MSGPEPRLSPEQKAELAADRRDGTGPGRRRRRALAARSICRSVIKERFGVDYHERYVGDAAEGARLLPHERAAAPPGAGRRDHRDVQKNFPRTLSAHLADLPKGTPVEIWFQDEARIGQKNGLVRQWARRGTRPRQPADQRYQSAYLFGAICPARGTGAALALPFADTEAMQLHLDEISRHVAPGRPCRAAARPRRLAHHRKAEGARTTSPRSSCPRARRS